MVEVIDVRNRKWQLTVFAEELKDPRSKVGQQGEPLINRVDVEKINAQGLRELFDTLAESSLKSFTRRRALQNNEIHKAPGQSIAVPTEGSFDNANQTASDAAALSRYDEKFAAANFKLTFVTHRGVSENVTASFVLDASNKLKLYGPLHHRKNSRIREIEVDSSDIPWANLDEDFSSWPTVAEELTSSRLTQISSRIRSTLAHLQGKSSRSPSRVANEPRTPAGEKSSRKRRRQH